MTIFALIISTVFAATALEFPEPGYESTDLEGSTTKASRNVGWSAGELSDFVDGSCVASAPGFALLDQRLDGLGFENRGPGHWSKQSITVQRMQDSQTCECIVLAPVLAAQGFRADFFGVLKASRKQEFLGTSEFSPGVTFARVLRENKEIEIHLDFVTPKDEDGLRFLGVFTRAPGECNGEVS